MRTAAISLFAAALAGAASAQPIPPPTLDLPKPATPSTSPSGQPLCAPEKLTRMVVRNLSPGLAAAAPAAQPRVIYRQGSIYLRNEESPDQRGQRVVIIAEPDIWSIDLATRTGQHQTDPGPEFVVRAPVLPLSAETPRPFLSLEFGCELEFLARNGAALPVQTIPWGERKATVHQVVLGEHVLNILLSERPAPLLVAYARGGKPVTLIRYDEYRNDLPDRPSLFARPSQMQITEALKPAPKPGTPPPKP